MKGGPAILINGAPFGPIFFSANNQFGRDGVLLEQLGLAEAADIPFFSFNLGLAWHQDAEEAAEVVERFCSAHPTGYFLLRIWLGANRAWLNAHPQACVTKANGERIGFASPSSPEWRESTAAMLRGELTANKRSPRSRGAFRGPASH